MTTTARPRDTSTTIRNPEWFEDIADIVHRLTGRDRETLKRKADAILAVTVGVVWLVIAAYASCLGAAPFIARLLLFIFFGSLGAGILAIGLRDLAKSHDGRSERGQQL